MADSKVSDLTAASALDGTELYYGVQGGADRKVTGAQIRTLASGVTVDTTTITGGTTARLLYDNAGTVGETSKITVVSSGLQINNATSVNDILKIGQVSNAGAISYETNIVGETYVLLGDNTGGSGDAQLKFGNAGALSWQSTRRSDAGSTDTWLGRNAAATLQQGAADAASPVAQTTTVQSVIAGTANTAGADWTFSGSKGTGTGVGGSILFKTAPAGGAGSSQNALATALTIDSTKLATFAAGLTTNGTLSTSGNQISFNGALNANTGYYAWAGRMAMYSPVDGTVRLTQSDDTTNVFLSVPAVATLQHGAADAAAPVAQTLTVQSVIAGTSNTAGADWTIAGSKGTGTGAGGSLVFKTAAAGGAGSSQNALATTLTLNSDGQTVLTAGTQALPALVLGSTAAATGFYRDANYPNHWSYTAGTTSFCFAQGEINFVGNGLLSWGSSVNSFSGSVVDTVIKRAAAATIQFGYADAASPVAQTTTVQSTVAGTTDTAGADWTRKASLGTGTAAGGNVIEKTGFSAKSTGSGQGTAVDRKVIVAKGKVLTDATPVSLFEIALPTLTMCGGQIEATVVCTNGTDMQSFTQTISYSAVNKGGVYTKSITASTGDKSVTGGSTLANTWTLLDGTNKVTVQLSSDTSLTPSSNAFLCYYSVKNNSEQATTIL